MKRMFAVLLAVTFLGGCSTHTELDRALVLRESLLQCNGCTFDATITADYGEKVYVFAMQCQTDQAGGLSFVVTDPQTIAGITGTVSQEGGKLTFDDQALAFELLADGQVTPVSAPWLLIRTLRSGYLRACARSGEGMRLTIDDSYEDDALQLDIWIDGNDVPTEAEILWRGKRVLSITVENFACV